MDAQRNNIRMAHQPKGLQRGIQFVTTGIDGRQLAHPMTWQNAVNYRNAIQTVADEIWNRKVPPMGEVSK